MYSSDTYIHELKNFLDVNDSIGGTGRAGDGGAGQAGDGETESAICLNGDGEARFLGESSVNSNA